MASVSSAAFHAGSASTRSFHSLVSRALLRGGSWPTSRLQRTSCGTRPLHSTHCQAASRFLPSALIPHVQPPVLLAALFFLGSTAVPKGKLRLAFLSRVISETPWMYMPASPWSNRPPGCWSAVTWWRCTRSTQNCAASTPGGSLNVLFLPVLSTNSPPFCHRNGPQV